MKIQTKLNNELVFGKYCGGGEFVEGEKCHFRRLLRRFVASHWKPSGTRHVYFDNWQFNDCCFLFAGADELSQNLTVTISDSRIRLLLESDRFVAIKIQSDSEAYGQFVQICKLYCRPVMSVSSTVSC